MNTSSLKSFAPAVRRQLMEAVTRKLDYVLTADTPDLRAAASQVKSLRKEADRNRTALIERVAYTWFNRLAAIRFLDARGWHPFHARVVTPAAAEETQPELLKLVRTGSLPEELRPHTDPDRLNDLLDGRLPTAIAGADPQGEVYRHLVLAVCRFYHAALPFLFEQLNDETELLLPDDLLTKVDRATMTHSLEARVPYLDHRFVEFCGRLDPVQKIRGQDHKHILKRVAERYLPRSIVHRGKQGFVMPLSEWLAGRLAGELDEHLGEGDVSGGGGVRRHDYSVAGLLLEVKAECPEIRPGLPAASLSHALLVVVRLVWMHAAVGVAPHVARHDLRTLPGLIHPVLDPEQVEDGGGEVVAGGVDDDRGDRLHAPAEADARRPAGRVDQVREPVAHVGRGGAELLAARGAAAGCRC